MLSDAIEAIRIMFPNRELIQKQKINDMIIDITKLDYIIEAETCGENVLYYNLIKIRHQRNSK